MNLQDKVYNDFKKILLFYVVVIVILILFLTIFNVTAFEDFYSYYSIDGGHIAQGQFPFRDFTPYYPIVMEYYLGLFGLSGMNELFARCIQGAINIAILFIIYDTCKIGNIKDPKKITFFYCLNTFMIFFSIVQINNDILLVLFILLAINFYLRQNYPLLGVFIALGFLTKLFAVIILIPITIFYLKNKKIKELFYIFIGFIATFLALIIPFWLISGSSIIDIVLNPFKMTLAHALSQPYYIIHGFGVSKAILQTVSSACAIGLILFYLLYFKRDEEELSLNTIYVSLTIFMLFQSFLVPWYFVWIFPLYHIIQKDNINQKSWLVQIFIWLNFLVYSLPGFLIHLSIIPTTSLMENFYTTVSLFGSIMFGLGALALQLSVLLLITDEKQDLPDKRLLLINCFVITLGFIFMLLTIFF